MTGAPKISKLRATEEPISETLWNLILSTVILKFFCLLFCLTDSNELFFVVILVLSYLLVSLVPY
jgi:hypothetical protein